MKFFALLLIAAFLMFCHGDECTKDICNLVDCAPLTKDACDGVFLQKGGYCGCCDACYGALEPGQPCETLNKSKPPKALCKDGYWCNNGVCRILLL